MVLSFITADLGDVKTSFTDSQPRNYLHAGISACISQNKFNVTLNLWLLYGYVFVEKHVTD